MSIIKKKTGHTCRGAEGLVCIVSKKKRESSVRSFRCLGSCGKERKKERERVPVSFTRSWLAGMKLAMLKRKKNYIVRRHKNTYIHLHIHIYLHTQPYVDRKQTDTVERRKTDEVGCEGKI